MQTVERLQRPDVLYGHFLYPSGAVVAKLRAKLKIPSVIAVGDDSVSEHLESFSQESCKKLFANIDGILAVSSKNKRDCENLLGIPEDKILMLPNGVDLSRFYPRDRVRMRLKFGLPLDRFIIAFTGHFNERKGPHRLIEAVSGLKGIGLVLAGEGPVEPGGDNVMFKGVLENAVLPELLSAADIFVLPTLMEGSCNAILEALACGLPVVTSRGEFNDDIVDDDVSIRVDPMDIREIRRAVVELSENHELRNRMSSAALSRMGQYDVNVRAKKIVEWICMIRKKSSHECALV